MRKKELIVGALSPFEGPWICIEEGEWLVEPPCFVGIVDKKDGIVLSGPVVRIIGPTKVRAVVDEDYEGEPLFLSIRQIRVGKIENESIRSTLREAI